MDIFQLIGDFLHLVAVLMLVLKILANKNCSGISYKTQEIYLIVFLTRYFDLFLFQWRSLYLLMMKTFFIGLTSYTIYLIRFKRPINQSYFKDTDSLPHYFIYLVALILSIIIHKSLHPVQFMWSFSIWLEAFAILPQLIIIQNLKDIQNITAHYDILYFSLDFTLVKYYMDIFPGRNNSNSSLFRFYLLLLQSEQNQQGHCISFMIKCIQSLEYRIININIMDKQNVNRITFGQQIVNQILLLYLVLPDKKTLNNFIKQWIIKKTIILNNMKQIITNEIANKVFHTHQIVIKHPHLIRLGIVDYYFRLHCTQFNHKSYFLQRQSFGKQQWIVTFNKNNMQKITMQIIDRSLDEVISSSELNLSEGKHRQTLFSVQKRKKQLVSIQFQVQGLIKEIKGQEKQIEQLKDQNDKNILGNEIKKYKTKVLQNNSSIDEQRQIFDINNLTIHPENDHQTLLDLSNSEYEIASNFSRMNLTSHEIQLVTQLSKINNEIDTYIDQKQIENQNLRDKLKQDTLFVERLKTNQAITQTDKSNQQITPKINHLANIKKLINIKGKRRTKFTLNPLQMYKNQLQKSSCPPIQEESEANILSVSILSSFNIQSQIQPKRIKFLQPSSKNVLDQFQAKNYQYFWENEVKADWNSGDIIVTIQGNQGEKIQGTITQEDECCVLYNSKMDVVGSMTFRKKQAQLVSRNKIQYIYSNSFDPQKNIKTDIPQPMNLSKSLIQNNFAVKELNRIQPWNYMPLFKNKTERTENQIGHEQKDHPDSDFLTFGLLKPKNLITEQRYNQQNQQIAIREKIEKIKNQYSQSRHDSPQKQKSKRDRLYSTTEDDQPISRSNTYAHQMQNIKQSVFQQNNTQKSETSFSFALDKQKLYLQIHDLQIIMKQNNPQSGKYATIQVDSNRPFVTSTINCNSKLFWNNLNFFDQQLQQSSILQISIVQQKGNQTKTLAKMVVKVTELFESSSFFVGVLMGSEMKKQGEVKLHYSIKTINKQKTIRKQRDIYQQKRRYSKQKPFNDFLAPIKQKKEYFIRKYRSKTIDNSHQQRDIKKAINNLQDSDYRTIKDEYRERQIDLNRSLQKQRLSDNKSKLSKKGRRSIMQQIRKYYQL